MPVTSSFDDATGLCLRFSCEMLGSSIPCLITIPIEGKCSEPLNVVVKVNCEETVFGLNLLNKLDRREPDNPCTYLLAIWTPSETAQSIQPREIDCTSQKSGNLCSKKTRFTCNSM
ncbi:hypothetical protein MRB53_011011 [Persea americana]|uniref:Uncharacterized protein n=1 Tax=Persea americana TaxID=3435 RepID=A0ACC2LTJ5_PERAE|nr:hypothetical protein MRB53_011011 [Persea americana]